MSNFSVTINYNCSYGYVEYDATNKTATVHLPIEGVRKSVEKFLQTPITMDVPKAGNVRDFVTKTMSPLDSIASFKDALTRLWVNTNVRVEWSMPPGMAEKL